jgi:hypothetical protein
MKYLILQEMEIEKSLRGDVCLRHNKNIGICVKKYGHDMIFMDTKKNFHVVETKGQVSYEIACKLDHRKILWFLVLQLQTKLAL